MLFVLTFACLLKCTILIIYEFLKGSLQRKFWIKGQRSSPFYRTQSEWREKRDWDPWPCIKKLVQMLSLKKVNPSKQLKLYRETAPVVAGSLTELSPQWEMLTGNFILHFSDSAVEDHSVNSTLFLPLSSVVSGYWGEKTRFILANSYSKKSAFLADLMRRMKIPVRKTLTHIVQKSVWFECIRLFDSFENLA